MEKAAEERLRNKFEEFFNHQHEATPEKILELILQLLKTGIPIKEITLFENGVDKFGLNITPTRNISLILQKICKIRFDEKVLEEVKKFLSSLEEVKECFYKEKNVLVVKF